MHTRMHMQSKLLNMHMPIYLRTQTCANTFKPMHALSPRSTHLRHFPIHLPFPMHLHLLTGNDAMQSPEATAPLLQLRQLEGGRGGSEVEGE